MTELRFISSSKRAVSVPAVLMTAETMHHLQATLYQQKEETPSFCLVTATHKATTIPQVPF